MALSIPNTSKPKSPPGNQVKIGGSSLITKHINSQPLSLLAKDWIRGDVVPKVDTNIILFE